MLGLKLNRVSKRGSWWQPHPGTIISVVGRPFLNHGRIRKTMGNVHIQSALAERLTNLISEMLHIDFTLHGNVSGALYLSPVFAVFYHPFILLKHTVAKRFLTKRAFVSFKSQTKSKIHQIVKWLFTIEKLFNSTQVRINVSNLWLIIINFSI